MKFLDKLALSGVLVGLLGCGSPPPQGTVGAACFPNSTCNAGLQCVSNVCTAATDSGADTAVTDTGMPDTATADTGMNDAGANDTGTLPDVAANPDVPVNEAGLPCPGATILHPGSEMRMVNTSIPFVGNARDANCTAITGTNLRWVDSREGMIGTGGTFNFTFTMTGSHTVTLTATSGTNMYTASVTFTLQ